MEANVLTSHGTLLKHGLSSEMALLKNACLFVEELYIPAFLSILKEVAN